MSVRVIINKSQNLLYILLFPFLVSFRQASPLYLLNQLYALVIRSFPPVEVVNIHPPQLNALYRV